jgi:c-di-GMP-binding flagellar brake protein YcgR
MRERRKARRYKLLLPMTIEVSIKNRPSPCNGKTLDLSTCGVYFVLDSNLEVGMKLGLTIRLPTGPKGGMEVFVLAIGTVVRVEKLSEKGERSVRVAGAVSRYEYFLNGKSDNSAHWVSSLARRFARRRLP